jgi:hypothetical protein
MASVRPSEPDFDGAVIDSLREALQLVKAHPTWPVTFAFFHSMRGRPEFKHLSANELDFILTEIGGDVRVKDRRCKVCYEPEGLHGPKTEHTFESDESFCGIFYGFAAVAAFCRLSESHLRQAIALEWEKIQFGPKGSIQRNARELAKRLSLRPWHKCGIDAMEEFDFPRYLAHMISLQIIEPEKPIFLSERDGEAYVNLYRGAVTPLHKAAERSGYIKLAKRGQGRNATEYWVDIGAFNLETGEQIREAQWHPEQPKKPNKSAIDDKPANYAENTRFPDTTDTRFSRSQVSQDVQVTQVSQDSHVLQDCHAREKSPIVDEKLAAKAPLPKQSPRIGITVPLADGSEYQITQADLDEGVSRYPAMDVRGEFIATAARYRAMPQEQRKTLLTVRQALFQWLWKKASDAIEAELAAMRTPEGMRESA